MEEFLEVLASTPRQQGSEATSIIFRQFIYPLRILKGRNSGQTGRTPFLRLSLDEKN
jgi:hypothetical protein